VCCVLCVVCCEGGRREMNDIEAIVDKKNGKKKKMGLRCYDSIDTANYCRTVLYCFWCSTDYPFLGMAEE